jgi:hypothetical protein
MTLNLLVFLSFLKQLTYNKEASVRLRAEPTDREKEWYDRKYPSGEFRSKYLLNS